MDNPAQKHGIAYEFDPARCQAVMKKGQCPFLSAEGSKFCMMHGGNKAAEAASKRSLHRYRLAKYQNRLDSLTDSQTIKSLRDEIAIVRMLVQHRLDICNDQSELLIHSTVIGRLILQIQSLTMSCAKVENALVDLMDQQAAFDTVQEVIAIVQKHAPDTVDQLIDDVSVLLENLTNHETKFIKSQYVIPTWQSSLAEYMAVDNIKTLRGEIGVIRIIIEEQLNTCHDLTDLMMRCEPICQNITKVEKLILSCHRLEQSGGLLLTRETAMAFGQEVLGLISTHVSDGETLEVIAREMGYGCSSSSEASAEESLP